MSNVIREIVYSIRHSGCPVSDASAAVPNVEISTISKIEKRDKRLRSLQHVWGDDDDIGKYVEKVRTHNMRTDVRQFTSVKKDKGVYIDLTIWYDDSLPSIAEIFSDHNCFQPRPITVKQGYENWPLYHDDQIEIRSISDQLDDLGASFEIRRSVDAKSISGSRLGVSTNETQGLTARQFEVLVTAKQMGYYDADRSVTMKDIAARLDLTSATICEHLNLAENHVISAIIDSSVTGSTLITGRSPHTTLADSP